MQLPANVQNCKDKLDPNQLRMVGARPLEVASRSAPCVSAATSSFASDKQSTLLYSVRSKSATAEIYWALKCVASNYSAASCDDIKDLFEVMFSDSSSVKNFSLGRTKFSYLLTDGLAPYFRNQLIKDLSNQYFTLYYDETTNENGSKELRTGVRYWSKTEDKVVSTHLRTYFIGKATGEELTAKITSAIDDHSLPLKKLLMLGSDGPTVNKEVHRLVNEKVKECRDKTLLDIGTCNVHIVHNSFNSGLEKFGEDVSDFIVLVHRFFDDWPSRREDFEAIQVELKLPTHRMIKHVSTRWLTIGKAADRIIEQWDALQKYFVEFIPKEKARLASSNSFVRIKKFLLGSTSRVDMIFVRDIAQVFSRFTATFQKEEPLIHVLHAELRTLALTLMGRVCKPSAIADKGVCLAVLNPENLLPLNDVAVGDNVLTNLTQVNDKVRLLFFKRAQNCILASLSHLLQKSALKSGSDVRYFRCLQPEQRRAVRSSDDFLKIARSLPVDVDLNLLLDEWKLLREEEDIAGSAGGRIDVYWSQFFKIKRPLGDELKYSGVAAVVKAALCLSHGQADVERGFSESKLTLSEDRASMKERTLDAYMVVKGALKRYNNLPHLVPVTRELLTRVEGAHAKYEAYLQDERKRREEKLKQESEREKEKLEEAKREEKLKDKREQIKKKRGKTEN